MYKHLASQVQFDAVCTQSPKTHMSSRLAGVVSQSSACILGRLWEEVEQHFQLALVLQDQCKLEMKQGRVFQHMREGPIRFPPTYKFNKCDPDPLCYDTSEKRRVPAWTDRIFFRGILRKDIPDVRLLY